MDKLHYKGKGEHSVIELELIIEQQAEELHLLNSGQKQLNMHDVSNSKVLEKPTMEKYGWHTQSGFDDEPSGWMYEGGEEAYYEALKKWEEQQ